MGHERRTIEFLRPTLNDSPIHIAVIRRIDIHDDPVFGCTDVFVMTNSFNHRPRRAIEHRQAIFQVVQVISNIEDLHRRDDIGRSIGLGCVLDDAQTDLERFLRPNERQKLVGRLEQLGQWSCRGKLEFVIWPDNSKAVPLKYSPWRILNRFERIEIRLQYVLRNTYIGIHGTEA